MAPNRLAASPHRMMAPRRKGESERLEVSIPTMGWEQINGDMDPGAHGGTIARGDGSRIELLKIQPVRDYVGDREAREVGFPFWTREASYDASDLDTGEDHVRSAMDYVGLDDDALRDMAPTARALALADALLDYRHGAEEGPAGWAADIIHEPVKWSSGDIAGAEHIADEDEAFRDDVLGYSELREAVEVKAQEMADQSSAQAWSTLGDQTRDQLEEAGFDRRSAVGVAEFGDAVAVNGDVETDATIAGVEAKLEKDGYELTELGGQIPSDEAEVSSDSLARAVAKESGRSEADVKSAAKGLDWWSDDAAFPWSTSGYGSVWAKRKSTANERRTMVAAKRAQGGRGPFLAPAPHSRHRMNRTRRR